MKKIVFVLTCFLFLNSCNKDDEYLKIDKEEVIDYLSSKELVKFVGKTMNIDVNDIKFNSKRDSLILFNKLYISVEETKSMFDNANEYRFKESKGGDLQ